LLPLVYTFTLLGGLAGEVRPVEYPQSWHEVNAILAKDPDCKALFLPWHEYYWLAFNHNILTGNTAPGFFDCRIISSHDAEIGDVGDQGKGPQYEAIARAVTDNHPESADATLAEFRKEGIRYMIVTNDLGTLDAFKYPFLTSPRLTTLYTGTVDNLHITLIQL
jgi:hypothetical protein